MAGIDSTVVAVALPAIGRNLHAGFPSLKWIVTSYTLTLASLRLLHRLPQRPLGRRRVFLAGLSWFTLASSISHCWCGTPSGGMRGLDRGYQSGFS